MRDNITARLQDKIDKHLEPEFTSPLLDQLKKEIKAMSTDIQPKRCPFCGDNRIMTMQNKYSMNMRCINCHGQGPPVLIKNKPGPDDRKAAIITWNWAGD